MTDILWVPIVGLALAILLFVVFFLAMAVAAILDIYDERKNRVWNELRRTNYEKRRPAAK
jgi:F0F1-type ATP synthase membrane subunit b/b'